MAADKATFAWRSILLHLANKLKQGEPQKIAFLADLPDKYRTNEISGEDVLERLQMDGFFSTSSSQGLFDIFTDLGRKDLAKQAKERVKEFHSKFGGDGMNNGGTTGSSCHCGRLEVELRSAIMHMVAAEDHLGKLFTPLLLLFSEKLRMQTENGLKHLKQVIWHFKTLYETMRETATPASGFSTSAGIISQDPSKEPNNAIYASPSECTLPPLLVNSSLNPLLNPSKYTSRPLPEQPASEHKLTITQPFQESEGGYDVLDNNNSFDSSSVDSDDGSQQSQETVIYTQPQEEDIIEKHDYSGSPVDGSPIGPVYEYVDLALASAKAINHHQTIIPKTKIQTVQNFSRSTGIRSPVRKGTSMRQHQGGGAATLAAISIKADASSDRKNDEEEEEDGYCTFFKQDRLKEVIESLDDGGGSGTDSTVSVP